MEVGEGKRMGVCAGCRCTGWVHVKNCSLRKHISEPGFEFPCPSHAVMHEGLADTARSSKARQCPLPAAPVSATNWFPEGLELYVAEDCFSVAEVFCLISPRLSETCRNVAGITSARLD